MIKRIYRTMGKGRISSIAEQSLISISNFLVFVFCARLLEKEEWGTFSLAFSLVLFLQGFQRSEIVLPMISFSTSDEIIKSDVLFWDRQQKLLVLYTTLLLLLMFVVMRIFSSGSFWISNGLLLSCALIPGMFFYEYYRRRIILLRRYSNLVLVSIVYSATLASSSAFSFYFFESAESVAISMSLSALLASFFGYISLRRYAVDITVNGTGNKYSGLREYRRNSRLAHVCFSAYNALIPIVLGFVSGPVGVAIFAATRTLVQPVQTLINAIDGIDKPRANRVFHESGWSQMWVVIRKTIKVSLIISGIYLVVLFVEGRDVLTLLYSEKYETNIFELRIWIMIAVLMLLVQPLESALYVIRETRVLFLSRLTSAVIALSTIAFLIPLYGAAGAQVGVLVGWLTSLIVVSVALIRIREKLVCL